jgi:[ribosomal protein S18]-alanine N-acetyltransferase
LTDEAIRFRTMTLADLPRVLAIERASFASPWTEGNFRHEIEQNPLAWNVVVERDAVTVAFACAYLVADELMVNDIAVADGQRRSGIGRALLRHLLDGARARGCRRATLEVRPTNVAARRLYDAFGFAVVGRRRGYYADTGEDALLMVRAL